MQVEKNNYLESEVEQYNSELSRTRLETSDEIWKDIPGYQNLYMVSSHGKVTSLNYHRTGKKKELKLKKIKKGYLAIGLSKNGERKWMQVHRLVGMAFIPNQNNSLEINHKNGNPSDNNVDNLEWVTHRENILHAYRTGLIISIKGSKHHKAKLTNEKIILIRLLYNLGIKQSALLNQFKISCSNISKIVRRKIWKHLKEDNPIRSQLEDKLNLTKITCDSLLQNEISMKNIERQVMACNNAVIYDAVA